MGSTTILRGFKVSIATLDAFLAANGVDETNGAPRFYQHHPDRDPISVLLYTKITKAGGTDKNKFRVLIPLREGYDITTAYVTYAWVTVFAQRELRLDEDLPAEVPTGFEGLREEILSFGGEIADSSKIADEGRMGLFAVYTDGIRGLFTPRANFERAKVPQYCDRCNAVFDDPHHAFDQRQEHRAVVHGCKEPRYPLPEE